MRLPESIVLTRSTMLCGRISQRVEQLDVELATAEATSAAWRDLVSSAEKVKRKVEEEERAAGVDHEPVDPPASWEPSGVQTWRRLHICEQVLAREPYRTLHRLA